MLEATSQFYQGGATASQVKWQSYAEEAAKAKVNSVYMDVLDQIRTSREQIENKQRQMQFWQVAKQQRFVHVNSIKSNTSSVMFIGRFIKC